MSARPIRVLIVDDSAVVRKILSELLAKDPGIEVVGTAIDPYFARDKILQLNPDVLTLDIEMPHLDGLSFLKLIMKHRPMPVVIISSLTANGSAKALEALQAGAVDVMAKPSGSYFSATDATELVSKIRAAFEAKLQPHTGETTYISRSKPAAPAIHRPAGIDSPSIAGAARSSTGPLRQYSSRQVILMGASTGGTEALKTVLTNLTDNLPGICIVQHIPAYFSKAFAERLNSLCALEVREARNSDKVQPGLVLVAPGGYHMLLRRSGSGYVVELSEGPMVHHQRPAVDILFDSAVRAGAGPHALGMLLTGMGADGAAGLLKLREAGGTTVAQDEATCVVFGMPREAIQLGAAQKVLPLNQMSAFIEHHASEVAIADTRMQA